MCALSVDVVVFCRGISVLRWRQGGIGKTTVSTYLVHEEGTRKRFERVVWVALGQEPNLAQLQSRCTCS